MSGSVIILLTLLAVILFVVLCWATFTAWSWLNCLYNDTPVKERAGLKALLLIPYILIAIWGTILYIALFLITLGGIVQLGGALRSWWHSGK